VIHHVSLGVSELAASGRFYDAVLGSLGWRRHIENDETLAWGIVRPVFFATAHPGGSTGGGGHVCFSASGISAVKAAWEGGIRTGGTDDGAPGQRPEYGASYYSAYLLDPDSNRVEIAVGSD
jgi:catechol 2,3-dioxygenase-like lactoylglutathione lyase family enzyme